MPSSVFQYGVSGVTRLARRASASLAKGVSVACAASLFLPTIAGFSISGGVAAFCEKLASGTRNRAARPTTDRFITIQRRTPHPQPSRPHGSNALGAELPEDLAQHAHQYRRIARGQIEPAHQ